MKKNQLLKKCFILVSFFLIYSLSFSQLTNNVRTNSLKEQSLNENNDPTGLIRWRREHPEQFEQLQKTRVDNNDHQRTRALTDVAQLNAQAQEQVVNFDDLTFTGAFSTITNPYQGFNWTSGPAPMPGTCVAFNGGSLGVHKGGPQYVNTGYEKGRVSDPTIAYNQFAGRPIQIEKSDGSAFTFVRGYFTGAFHALHISFQGYNGSTLIHTSAVYPLSNTEPTLITLNWSNITRLMINIEETDCLSHLVMDDLTFRNDEMMVVSFTLIDARADQDIGELKDGDVINLASLPSIFLNLRANTNPAVVGSVLFDLSGPVSFRHTENTAPYALLANNMNDYYGIIPPLGDYTLTATPYSEAGGRGEKGTAKTIRFKVVFTLPITSVDPKLNSGAGAVKADLRAAPNPSRGVSIISFLVPQTGYTTLEVIDQRGAVLERLYASQAEGGKVYTLPFESRQLKDGFYILRLISGKHVQSYKLMLMK